MSFGEKLQSLRKDKGLSQEQLAAKLGVSRQAVSKWELDSSLPDTVNVIQIAELFGVSLDYLLKEDVQKPGKNNTSIIDEKPAPFIKNKGLLAFRLGVFSLVFSIVAYAVMRVWAKLDPAPIFYHDANTGLWKVGFENFILYHSLSGFLDVLAGFFVVGLLLIFHRQILTLLKRILKSFS